MNGFSASFRLDWNGKRGGNKEYVREDIPSKLLSVELYLMEGFFVELNLRKKKECLFCCCYNLKKALITNLLSALIILIGKNLC